LEHFARLDHPRGEVDGLAAEQVQLAEEAALAVDADRALVLAAGVLDDRDLA